MQHTFLKLAKKVILNDIDKEQNGTYPGISGQNLHVLGEKKTYAVISLDPRTSEFLYRHENIW